MSSKYRIEEDRSDFSEINIIPLVDVMLVLLIIFMITAPLSIGGLRVQLPVSKAQKTTLEESRVILTVNDQGEFYMDSNRIESNILEQKLAAIYEHREKKELYIRADKRVVYEKVVEAISAAKLAGVTKIGLLTQSSQTPQ